MTHEPLRRTTSPALANSLTRLTFLAQRRPHTEHLLDGLFSGRLDELAELALDVAIDVGDPLGTALARRLDAEASLELIERLAERLSGNPYASVLTLRETSVVVFRRALEHRRASWTQPDAEQRGILAALAHNLGQDLSYLGRWAEASTALEEALAGYRDLEDPDLSKVASCLLEQGVLLTRTGRRSEALEKSREAVELRRRLVDGGRGRLDLAGALNNLGADLSDLGYVWEALEPLTEAVGIYEDHRGGLDVFHERSLANTLVCLGNQHSSLGRFGAAREALEQGVTMLRRLTAERPTTFQPDLAVALTDFALLLYSSDRELEAQEIEAEATSIFRDLAKHRRAAFGADLAWSTSRGLSRSELTPIRRMTEELDLLREAIELYRQRAREHPLRFEPPLAESLSVYGEQLEDAGQLEPALAALDEAVPLLRRMSEDPRYGDLNDDLGWSLVHRSSALQKLGHWQEAASNAQEAVDVFLRQADDTPTSCRNRAAAHHELGVQLSFLGHFEQALRETSTSVQLYQRLAAEQPGVFRTELASALLSLGNQLHAADRLAEAASVSRQAVDLCRQLVEQRGEGYLEMLAVSLNNLGLRLRFTGPANEALAVLREAVEIYREAHGAYLLKEENYAESLHNLGTILNDQGQFCDARLLFEEAVERRRRLAEARPEAFAVDLAFSLVNLGATLNAEGDHKAAAGVDREAVDLLRQVVEGGRSHVEPELGVALANLAHQYHELARPREALATAREALEILSPRYDALMDNRRQAAHLAMGVYLEGCKQSGVEPDDKLVQPLLLAIAAAVDAS